MTVALLGVVVSLVVAQSNRRTSPRRALTSTTRPNTRQFPHTGIGLMRKLPAWVTHRTLSAKLKQLSRSWHPKGTRSRVVGDTGVTRQTILLTKVNPNDAAVTFQGSTSQDQHPFYTMDETFVYFDSDRNSATDSTESVSKTFNVFRMAPDGSNMQQITGTAATDTGQHLEPNVATNNKLLTYVAGGTVTSSGDPTVPVNTAGFNLFFVDVSNAGATPTQLTGSGPANTFADVRHPSFAPVGTSIAFAGKRNGETVYHIYTVDFSSGTVTQLTGGIGNDYSPAWSPALPTGGSVIAFTSNATGYTSTAAPVVSSGSKATDDLWVVQPIASRPAPRRITNFSVGTQVSTNRNPAWSTITPDNRTNGVAPNPAQPLLGRLMLAFASTRVDGQNNGVPDGVSPTGTTDIYMLDAPIGIDAASGATTVTQVEQPFSSTGTYTGARKLMTSNPQADLDAIDKPLSGLNDNGNNFDSTHASSEDFPSFPQFQTTYRVVYQSDRGANLNIWASSILDLEAPTLLKYDEGNNEIVRVETTNGSPLPTGRYVDAGTTIRFRVRAVDYQSGIKYAYLQIKCPDSQQQSDDGKEHKIFYAGNGQLDTPLFLYDHSPYEWDAQAIKATDTQTGPVFRPYLNFTANSIDPTVVFNEFGTSKNAPPFVASERGSPEFNWYTPGIEDFNAYSGNLSPPDDANIIPPGSTYKDGNPGFWLPLTQNPDPLHRDEWIATWQTPAGFHSDMILDVILYDNAVYPFDASGGTQSNWKIYDNIWGFTTKAFSTNSQLLYVSDYDTGQKFLNNRFGFGTYTNGYSNTTSGIQNGAGLTFEGNPTESWMTEFDSRLFPALAYNPGTPIVIHQTPHFETPLGANSYGNNGQDPLVGVGANNVPITGQYDIWRIQCRGPIPAAVLNLYGARTSQPQPPDILATPPETVLRRPLVADRCVIWHAPYAGDLFVGPGTILDQDTQTLLTGFVNGGGRLFMNGQDVAFGLSLGQSQLAGPTGIIPQGNAFLNNTLRAYFISDSAITGGGGAQDAIGAGGGARGNNPIGITTFFLPALHGDFINPGAVGDNPPLSQPPLYISPTVFVPTTNHDYGCPSQGYELQNIVPVGFPNQIAFNPPTFPTLPAGASATFYPGQYGIDATYSNGSPAIIWARNAVGGKIVFSPVGFESINPAQQAVPNTNPTVYDLLNRRVELMHNVLDYLRTGRIVGTIRLRNATGSVTGVAQHAFVRAQGRDYLTGNTVTYGTAYTDNSGNYRIEGLDAQGLYTLDAAMPGFTTGHVQGVFFHGGYQAQSDQYIIQAQPGQVTGLITSLATGQPVAGIIVQATDSTDPTNTNPATFFSDPSKTDGTYVIRNLPTSKYILTVTQASLTAAGYSGSIPVSSAITIAAGQTVSDPTLTNFKLTQPPVLSVTGIVVQADANGNPIQPLVPIIGATVTPALTVGTASGTLTPVQTTGPGGTFTFTGPTALAPGTYGLTASAPGFSPSNVAATGSTPIPFTASSGQTVTGIIIALKALPPGSISGLVTSSPPLSAPIGGATITVADSTGKTLTVTTTAVQTVTLSDGTTYKFNYVVTGVSAGSTVTVTATKAGFTPKPNPDTQTVAVTTGAETRNINFILDALYTYSPTLTLVSSPYQFPVTVTDLFSIPGADINTTFAFVGWNPDTQKYVFYPTPPADGFHYGQGYFLQETNTLTTLALTNPNGVLYGDNNPMPFNISLRTGWNLIGDPYTVSLDLAKLQIIEPDGTLKDLPSAQSGSSPDIGGALYTYENGSYEIVYTIDQFRGYWIRAFRPVTLVLSPGAQQTRGAVGLTRGRALEEMTKDKNGAWKVGLKATVGDGKMQIGSKAYFGVSTHATDGYDIYKMPTPPAMNKQAVQVSFDHKDWGDKAAGYMADIRSPQNTSWDFTVTSSVPNAPVTLSWPGMATLSRRIDMKITDLDTQQTFSMRSRSSIALPASGDTLTKRYRVEKIFASHNSDLQLTNLAVTPSSTGRGASGVPTPVGISYNLSGEATVQVSILQGGRRIRTVHSATRAAGANQESWDLKTDGGSTVATNVYTVEVRAINPATGRTVRQVQNVLVTR